MATTGGAAAASVVAVVDDGEGGDGGDCGDGGDGGDSGEQQEEEIGARHLPYKDVRILESMSSRAKPSSDDQQQQPSTHCQCSAHHDPPRVRVSKMRLVRLRHAPSTRTQHQHS